MIESARERLDRMYEQARFVGVDFGSGDRSANVVMTTWQDGTVVVEHVDILDRPPVITLSPADYRDITEHGS